MDFRYDAAGRLVRKDANGVVQRYFLWQGQNMLAELNATATGKVAEYSYYPGMDNLHAVITGTTPYFAHTDGLGNVIALTDSATPSVLRSYDYDAWGGLVWGNDFKPFANADRARFKGALWLGPEADVYFMRARWYEPKTGRFLSEDPIGLDGGINPYVFAGGDPINRRDPTGTCASDEEMWFRYYDNDRDGRPSAGDTFVEFVCKKKPSSGEGSAGPGQTQQQQQQCPLTLPALVRQAGENAYWRSYFSNVEQVTVVVNNSTILPVVPVLSTQMRVVYDLPSGTTAQTHGHLKLGPTDYTYGSVSPTDMNRAKTRGFSYYAFSVDSVSQAFPDSTRLTCFDERIAPWGVP